MIGNFAERFPTRIVRQLPDGQRIEVSVMGEPQATPSDPGSTIEHDRLYDALIVGAGYSGLSAAWHLKKQNILVIESQKSLGGLGAQGSIKTGGSWITYARGAAYYTEPDGAVKKIYNSVGLTPPKRNAIAEPIDSYLFKDSLILNMWSRSALKRLGPSFGLFKKELRRLIRGGFLDFNPPEPVPDRSRHLDAMSVAQFLKPFGDEVVELLDSYTRSALGGHTNQVSALAFLLFYMDEIETRYAWPGGTGGGSRIMARKLWEARRTMFRTRSYVRQVSDTGRAVEVIFDRDGKRHVVRGRRAIVAVPLHVAAKIVPQMPATTRAIIAEIEYADYIVHTIFTNRDLYKKSYDSWFRTGGPFTDVIAGRWVETKGFSRRTAGPGILTVYMPLSPPQEGRISRPGQVADLAAVAALELRKLVPELSREGELKVESYCWPKSIHLAKPGYLTDVAPSLHAPVGNIHFASNNLGTPSFETSLLEGRRAALEAASLPA